MYVFNHLTQRSFAPQIEGEIDDASLSHFHTTSTGLDARFSAPRWHRKQTHIQAVRRYNLHEVVEASWILPRIRA